MYLNRIIVQAVWGNRIFCPYDLRGLTGIFVTVSKLFPNHTKMLIRDIRTHVSYKIDGTSFE